MNFLEFLRRCTLLEEHNLIRARRSSTFTWPTPEKAVAMDEHHKEVFYLPATLHQTDLLRAIQQAKDDVIIELKKLGVDIPVVSSYTAVEDLDDEDAGDDMQIDEEQLGIADDIDDSELIDRHESMYSLASELLDCLFDDDVEEGVHEEDSVKTTHSQPSPPSLHSNSDATLCMAPRQQLEKLKNVSLYLTDEDHNLNQLHKAHVCAALSNHYKGSKDRLQRVKEMKPT